MGKTENLSASLEDYLAAIFAIAADRGVARVKDIAEKLNVKAGSVTTALQALAKNGYINYKPYELITLTDQGIERAKQITRKHEILQDFFIAVLGADEETAEAAACKMEHLMPDELIERLVSFMEFIQSCPRSGQDWLSRFNDYCLQGRMADNDDCAVCIEKGIKTLQHKKSDLYEHKNYEKLSDIPKGKKCIVRKINRKISATKRFIEMGINKGTIIEVERVAPLGDPIEVKVKGYHLSVRKSEAAHIEVERQ